MITTKKTGTGLILFLYSVFSLLIFILLHVFADTTEGILPVFILKWKLLNSLISFVSFFPALLLSTVLVVFNGDSKNPLEGQRFSGSFLTTMAKPMSAVLTSAILYSIMALLILPLSTGARNEIQSKSQLYSQASSNLDTAIDSENWLFASRYMAICEKIWPYNPALESQRNALIVEIGKQESSQARNDKDSMNDLSLYRYDTWPGASLPGASWPMNNLSAISMAENAERNSRLYDAHWLYTVAERLSKAGSPEQRNAQRKAAEMISAIENSEPDREKDKSLYDAYQKMREGYQAIQSEDWIRSYYIFQQLEQSNYYTQDVQTWLALSTEGIKHVAFFSDELGAVLGRVDNNALFSIPGPNGGRDIITAATAYLFADATYLQKMKISRFDAKGTELFSASTSLAKLIPFPESLHSAANTEISTNSVLLLVSLDKNNPGNPQKPIWTGPAAPDSEETRISINLPYEQLFLLSNARRDIQTLGINSLLEASKKLGPYGFVEEVFRAEFLKRLTEPFALLSLAIFCLAIGWRLRNNGKTHWWLYPIYVLLPMICFALFSFVQILVASFSAVFVLSLSFPLALSVMLFSMLILLFSSLLYLAGQRM